MEKHKSDGWKPGDLALCIKGGQISTGGVSPPEHPVTGRLYTVSDAKTAIFYLNKVKLALWLKDGPQNSVHGGWDSARFIKINPEDLDDSEEVRKQLEIVL